MQTIPEVMYANAGELRAIADLIDQFNKTALALNEGAVVNVDNIMVTDTNGLPLGVLSWRTEGDTFGLALG